MADQPYHSALWHKRRLWQGWLMQEDEENNESILRIIASFGPFSPHDAAYDPIFPSLDPTSIVAEYDAHPLSYWMSYCRQIRNEITKRKSLHDIRDLL